jgi:hypothetical protein
LALACVVLLLATSCSRKDSSEWLFESRARPLVASPSLAPQLATLPSGVVLATAVRPNGKGADDPFFYTSANDGDLFRQLLRLNSGVGEVHSHREGTPRLLTGGPGNYYALWTGPALGGYGMNLYLSRSNDYGDSFSRPISLDAQAGGSHPYFNAATARDGTMVVVWISYDTVPGAVPGTGTLQLIRSTDGGGSFSAPTRVSVDVCACCRPELKTDGQETWYLAWRHVAPDQERDIMLAALHDNGATWSESVFVSHDRWHINGCPDSGPSLALLTSRFLSPGTRS